jgi:hypothetical protein
MTTLRLDRPAGICGNCLATWRAAKPQPRALYCWHTQTLARPRAEGWETVSATDSALRAARKARLL